MYAVVRGHTTGIFTSWSACELSIHKFPGQVFNGFEDLDSAIDFMRPYSYSCTTVPVYNYSEIRQSPKDFGHSCSLCTQTKNSTHDVSHDQSYTLSESEESESDNISSDLEDNILIEMGDSESESETHNVCPKNPTDADQTFLKISIDNDNTNQYPSIMRSRINCKNMDNVQMIMCNSCSGWMHYQCSKLPPYMLFSLSTSKRKYTCMKCVQVPDNFYSGKQTLNSTVEI